LLKLLSLAIALAGFGGQPKEPGEPAPTASSAAVLDQCAKLVTAKSYEQAIELAKPLADDQSSKDLAGRAAAWRLIADTLAQEGKADESIAAWKFCTAQWALLGDGPGQIQADVFILALSKPGSADATAALDAAITLTKEEQKRPLAAEDKLQQSFPFLNVASRFDECEKLARTVLDLEAASHRGGLQAATAMYNMGRLAFNRSQFATAVDWFQKAIGIRETLLPNSVPLGDAYIYLSDSLRLLKKNEQAADANRKALAVLLRVNPRPNLLATAWLQQGFALESTKPDLAIKSYQAAAEIFDKPPGNPERVAVCWIHVGISFNNLGRTKESLVWLSKAATKLHSIPTKTLAIGRDFVKLGESESNLECYDIALGYFMEAYSIESASAPGSIELANLEIDLGQTAQNMGDMRTDWYQKGIGIFESKEPNSADLSLAYNDLGEELWEIGQLSDAETALTKALSAARKVDDPMLTAYALENLANVASDRKDFDENERLLHQALPLALRSDDTQAIGDVYGLLGSAADDRGHLQEAIHWYELSRQFFEKREPGSIDLSIAYDDLGLCASREGKWTVAEEWYGKGLAIREKIEPGSLRIAEAKRHSADLALKRHQYDRAVAFALEAKAIETSKAPGSLALELTCGLLAQSYLARGDLGEAESNAAIACECLDFQRSLGSTSESAKALRVERDEATGPELLLECQCRRNESRAALATVERFRGRSLADFLFENTTSFAGGDSPPEELLRRQADLSTKIRAAQIKLKRADATDRPTILQSLNYLRADQRDLEAQIRSASPRYAALKYPLPLDAAGVQQALDPGTLLLSYCFTNDSAWLFAVTSTSLRLVKLGASPSEISSRMTGYEGELSSEAPCLKDGASLFQLLVAPVMPEVRKCSRLLICPQGPLAFIPFSSLVVSGQGENLQKAVFLGDLRPISITASVTALVQERRPAAGETDRNIELLVMGDPAYSDAEIQSKNLSSTLSSLHSMRPGLERISGQPGGVSLFEQQATISNLLLQGPKAKIIHIACHGKAIPSDPLSSWLALTPSSGDDGMLTAGDIIGKLRLNADLVVLCACESAMGQSTKSEGIDGLTRSTLIAGARSVVSSLWLADVGASDRLMQSFYSHLRKGENKDVALQAAQKELRSDSRYRHPRFWSTFILTGDYR